MKRAKSLVPALVLSAIALLATQVTAAAAAWPGANGDLYFAALIPRDEPADEGLGIFSAPLGGHRASFRTLSGLSTDTQPAVSPDGRQFAFLRSTGSARPGQVPTAAIYAMAPDGSAQRSLTEGSYRDLDPTFSASGKQILFSRQSAGRHIYSAPLAGGPPRRITGGPGADTDPVASPNGRLIAFERRSGARRHVFVSRPSGARPRDITRHSGPANQFSALDPDFSPDGRRIAYVENESLLVTARPDGSSRRVLTHRAPEGSLYRNPAYSPDGRFLIFAKIDAETGRSSLLRFNLKHRRFAPNPLVQPHTTIQAAVWAPRPR